MPTTITPTIEAFRLREDFGPRTLYSYGERTLGTAEPRYRQHDDGGIEIVGELRCSPVVGLDVAGQARTGPSGTVVWRLSENVCDLGRVVAEPVSFVATPTTEESRFPFASPFDPPRCTFLTVEYDVVDDGRDLEVTVSSWTPDCTTVGDVPFSYRALVQVIRRID